MPLESTEPCKLSCSLLVHRRKDSPVQCSPSDVLAHRQARTVGLVSDDGFLLFRDAEFDPYRGALCPCGSCHCPLRFCGVSGRSPEQDAQLFLRVAESGLEKWCWLDETPQGFCPDSAYLAIQCLAIQFFVLNPISARFSVQHNNNT
jgi:hypothetical protein